MLKCLAEMFAAGNPSFAKFTFQHIDYMDKSRRVAGREFDIRFEKTKKGGKVGGKKNTKDSGRAVVGRVVDDWANLELLAEINKDTRRAIEFGMLSSGYLNKLPLYSDFDRKCWASLVETGGEDIDLFGDSQNLTISGMTLPSARKLRHISTRSAEEGKAEVPKQRPAGARPGDRQSQGDRLRRHGPSNPLDLEDLADDDFDIPSVRDLADDVQDTVNGLEMMPAFRQLSDRMLHSKHPIGSAAEEADIIAITQQMMAMASQISENDRSALTAMGDRVKKFYPRNMPSEAFTSFSRGSPTANTPAHSRAHPH